MAKERSPFGTILRAHRLQRGLSQRALSQLIFERSFSDPALAELGVITEKAIADLEARRVDASQWVRPRPLTVRLLASTFELEPGSEEETTFLEAADRTRKRTSAPAASPSPSPSQPDKPAATGIGQDDDSRPLFIREGREEHIQHLERLLEQALAGTPQVALIAGEPGVGKTWLITEICRLAQQRNPDVVVAWGECTGGAGAVEPYLPFRQALGHMLGTTRAGPTSPLADDQQRQRQIDVLEALLTHAPSLVGTYIDETFLLARATELGIVDQAWHDRLNHIVARRGNADTDGRFDQVAELLGAIANLHPIILVLEDLHWADDRTCALLFHMQRRLQRVTNVPVLILASYRPSDLTRPADQPRHPLELTINEIGRHVDQAVVDLSTTVGPGPGHAFIDALLTKVLPDRDDQLRDLLFARTEGFPLFAVELLHWLRETGMLTRDAATGQWQVGLAPGKLHAPGKVRAVIAGRLARLPEEQRRILATAAVQGSMFSADVVASILQLAPEAVDDLIDAQLVRRYRMLEPAETLTIAGKRLYRYRFAHALFQEHLYDKLSVRERERLHGSTARVLVELLGDEAHGGSGEIAFHFDRAGEPRDASLHAYRAGQHVNERSHYQVAAEWFERAIALGEVAGDPKLVAQARNGLAGTLRSRSRVEEGVLAARQALDEARLHGCSAVAAESLALLGLLAFDRGKYIEAATYLRQSLAEYRQLDDITHAAGIESLLSHACYGLGAYNDAIAHAQSAYEAAKSVGHHRYAAEALLARTNCEVDLGHYAAAIERYQEATRIYRLANDLRGEALCLLNIGLCQTLLGNCASAKPVLRQAKTLCEDLQLTRLVATADHYLGLAYEGAGALDDAEAYFSAARTLRRDLKQPGFAIDSLAGLLRVVTRRGDRERMRSLVEEIEEWIAEHGVVGIEDPIFVYLSGVRARHALGDAAGIQVLLDAGRTLLLKRADRILDADARASYLEEEPINRALLTWSPEEPPTGTMPANGHRDTAPSPQAR